jgi:hypothetical protein
MEHVVLGLFALLAGAVFCFRGYRTMRVILPIWGAFVGFILGASAVAIVSNQGLLATAAGWIVSVCLAILFGWLSYAYYSVSVALSFAGIGFSITASILGLAGIENRWVYLIVAGGAALLCAVLALNIDLPFYALVVMSAWAGAGAIVTGVIALARGATISSGPFVITTGRDATLGAFAALVLTIAGIFVQVQDRNRQLSLRDQW